MLFRSEKVHYYDLTLPYESAWPVMNSLGKISALQIIDSHKDDNVLVRDFVEYVRRCDEMSEKIDQYLKIADDFDIEIKKCDDIQQYIQKLDDQIDSNKKAGDAHLEEIEHEVSQRHGSLTSHIKTYEELDRRIWMLKEKYQVMTLVKPHIPKGFTMYYNAGDDGEAQEVSSVRFCYICGTLETQAANRFQKVVFRVTRGNSFTSIIDIPFEEDAKGNFKDVERDSHGNAIKKSIFFLAFQQGGSQIIKDKLVKLCQAFGAVKYNLPESYDGFDEEIRTLKNDLASANQIRVETTGHIRSILLDSAGAFEDNNFSYIHALKIQVLREKSIYNNLNRMKLKDNIFYGQLWIPREFEGQVKQTLATLSKKQNFTVPDLQLKDYKQTGMMPPTYFKTNEFTAPFQEIVETYGIPTYREVNPGLFTIVSFPYLFGVMFGDIGHGGLLFAFGIFLVLRHRTLKGTMLEGASPLRFMLFLMGMFAFYNGFTYNEFFAIPLRLFGSCYDEEFEREEQCNYPIGIDPAFYMSTNEVAFLNSFKMKLSIIIGVIHMSFGICMRAFNAVHFDNYVDLIFEFVPQLVFFMVTFGYMCVAILIKWLTNYDGSPYPPPSILNIYTGMGITVSASG